ncbi:acetylglutamate kinase [Candidatus Woesearchaeota archaeon]|nr:acetylglutamate kinase [Candidatus Woesearchaeota archaeon]
MAKSTARRPTQDIEYLESLAPYIGEFVGKTFVLKAGGEVLGETLDSLAHEIAILYALGIKLVLVHGGGTQISAYSREIGLEPRKVEGLRITDEETLEQAVRPVMAELNKSIVSALAGYGADAISLQLGDKPGLIAAKRAPPKRVRMPSGRKKPVDLGFVGEVAGIKEDALNYLLDEEYIPVISSLGMDEEGAIYNINADKVAGAVAEAVEAEKLMILTDVKGVYDHETKRHHTYLISYMDTKQARRLIRERKVTSGMIPKLETCVYAVEHGVPRAHIVKGTDAYSLIREVLGPGTGTMVVTPTEMRRYRRELRKLENRG